MPVRRGDDWIVIRRAEHELRAALGGFGRNAPAFVRLNVKRQGAHQRFRFEVDFDRKPSIGWFISDEDLTRQGLLDVLHPTLELAFRSLYSRLYEDHLIELDLNVARRHYLALVNATVDRNQLAAAREQFDNHAAMIRESHRGAFYSGIDFGRLVGDRTAVAVRDQLRGRHFDLQIIDDIVVGDFTQTMNVPELEQVEQLTATQVRDLTQHARAHQIEALQQMMAVGINQRSSYRWVTTHEAIYGGFIYGDVGDDKAQQKGLALLKDWLSPEQRAQYDKHKYFEVKGGSTGKRYRINHGRQMNIDELDDAGDKVTGWCFLPEGQLVAGDVMLAQKIALETNELAALKVANRIPLDGMYGTVGCGGAGGGGSNATVAADPIS